MSERILNRQMSLKFDTGLVNVCSHRWFIANFQGRSLAYALAQDQVLVDSFTLYYPRRLKGLGIRGPIHEYCLHEFFPKHSCNFISRWQRLLPFPRSDSEQIPLSSTIGIHRSVGKFTGLVDAGVLHTRGWVVQERCLSPRTLHCTSAQLFWECDHGSSVEDGLPVQHGYNIFRPEQKKSVSATNQDNSPGDLLYPQDDKAKRLRLTALNQLNELIQYYPACSLTKQTDILPAISGLAQHFSRRIHSRYVAGLWEENFIEGLCWHLEKSCSTNTPFGNQP
jgi:hypothetical protein